jgi:hypothetical protein
MQLEELALTMSMKLRGKKKGKKTRKNNLLKLFSSGITMKMRRIIMTRHQLMEAIITNMPSLVKKFVLMI